MEDQRECCDMGYFSPILLALTQQYPYFLSFLLLNACATNSSKELASTGGSRKIAGECLGYGASCTMGSDCCSGTCSPAHNNTCDTDPISNEPAPSCLGYGASCTMGSECCSGTCNPAHNSTCDKNPTTKR